MSFLYLEETSFHKLGTLSDSLGNLTALKLIPGPGAFSQLGCDGADGSYIYRALTGTRDHAHISMD